MESDWGWPAIGIDLGDRFSRVAIWQHGKVEIIVNDQGNRKTLSYVAFTDNEHLIGDAAKNQSSQNPAITIFGAAAKDSSLESSTSLILNDIDSLLEDLYKVSKKKSISISSSKVQFLKLLEEIRRNPNDLHFTGELSQLLQDFHPSLPMHSLTVIKSLEEDILASQHRFMEWTKKEVAAPLKLREAGTIQSRLVNIKNQILQKTSSRDQLRSRIAETDKEIAKLMNCKSQLEKDHCLADQDLGRLTRSICPQVDVARQKSAQLAHLREASNFKAKAWFSLEAALDSFANYLKNL
uniref:Uncharacterized protein n=1 Tax=Chenopodium quinoa TaxID=63459 RepID=A0A803LHH1_CHEQI